MRNVLPDGVEKYAESPLFNEETVPEKLTSEHDLKAGVWGKLCVIDGSLEYHLPGEAHRSQLLKAGEHAVIEPQQVHFVKPVRNVQFKVEFYR